MYVEIGKIVGVWGVKGWVKLHSYTRNRLDIADYPRWFLQAPQARSGRLESPEQSEQKEVAVLVCRAQGQGIVAQLEGVTDRDQAASLNGFKISVSASDLPELPNGEYYWQQLIGLQVANQDGVFARVASMLETGANDVLVCKSLDADKDDILIPYTDQTVIKVDLESALIEVDWDPDYLQS